MLRNILLGLAALVLLAAVAVTGNVPGVGLGSKTFVAKESDTPTLAERMQILEAAAAIGSLYFCDKTKLYTAIDASRGAPLHLVGWSLMTNVFAPYEELQRSSMYVGALVVQEQMHDTATGGVFMRPVGNDYIPVAISSAEICMEAEAVLRTIMQPGKVLDGKWRPAQGSA